MDFLGEGGGGRLGGADCVVGERWSGVGGAERLGDFAGLLLGLLSCSSRPLLPALSACWRAGVDSCEQLFERGVVGVGGAERLGLLLAGGAGYLPVPRADLTRSTGDMEMCEHSDAAGLGERRRCCTGDT